MSAERRVTQIFTQDRDGGHLTVLKGKGKAAPKIEQPAMEDHEGVRKPWESVAPSLISDRSSGPGLERLVPRSLNHRPYLRYQ